MIDYSQFGFRKDFDFENRFDLKTTQISIVVKTLIVNFAHIVFNEIRRKL